MAVTADILGHRQQLFPGRGTLLRAILKGALHERCSRRDGVRLAAHFAFLKREPRGLVAATDTNPRRARTQEQHPPCCSGGRVYPSSDRATQRPRDLARCRMQAPSRTLLKTNASAAEFQ
jgi:hypothetical protein